MNGLNTHFDHCMVARDKLTELLTTLEYIIIIIPPLCVGLMMTSLMIA